uniref:hypothetical protein n=1 Tax=Methanobrevibacter sp. TaxID=66852 RepID=UPI00386D8CFC
METNVKYKLQVKSSNKDYELIRHICHLRYDSSYFPAVEYNDKYKVIEIDYYTGSGIYQVIEDTRMFKELLKDEDEMEFEINGVEDSDYGNFNLFQIIYKNKDAMIRQVPFNIDEDNMDCCDLVFAISGKLKYFENRDDIVETIEELGGILSNTVSKNTDY